METVTCLCPTRNRRKWLPQAIRSFQAQTYPNRVMLIVADGEEVGDLIPKDDPRVSLVIVGERPMPITTGEKRNLACSLVQTDVIAHWDDDDWSAPTRLSDQMARLKESGKAVTGYNRLLFTDGAEWWRYLGVGSWAAGTSLVFKRAWWAKNQFAHVVIGSDNVFAYAAADAHEMMSVDAGELMVARNHPDTTNRRSKPTGCNWETLVGYSGPVGFQFAGAVL